MDEISIQSTGMEDSSSESAHRLPSSSGPPPVFSKGDTPMV